MFTPQSKHSHGFDVNPYFLLWFLSHQALNLNPFLWHAFAELCRRGEKPDPQKTFQVEHLESFAMCHGTNPVIALVNNCQSDDNTSHLGSGSGPVSGNVSGNSVFESSFHTVNS